MQPSHESDRLEVVRHLTLGNGPICPHPNSTQGRRFRVTRVTIRYVLTEGAWRSHHVSAYGPILKADGIDSRNTCNVTLVTVWKSVPEWQFLHALIDGARPKGVPELPFGPFDFGPDGTGTAPDGTGYGARAHADMIAEWDQNAAHYPYVTENMTWAVRRYAAAVGVDLPDLNNKVAVRAFVDAARQSGSHSPEDANPIDA